VLLLPDPVDSFWVTSGLEYEGKPFKSATQGAADLALIPVVDTKARGETAAPDAVKSFVDAVKAVLGDQVADVRLS
jgi:molecular chaperone HtpG